MPTLLDSLLDEARNASPNLRGYWSNIRPTTSLSQTGSGLGFGFGQNETGGSPARGISASSFGTSPFGREVPDFSKADPAKLRELGISDLVYSIPAGGYITKSAASNANSYEIKYGKTSPGADARAAAYYNYINSLPKVAQGTTALNQLNAINASRSTPPAPQTQSVLGYQVPWRWGR